MELLEFVTDQTEIELEALEMDEMLEILADEGLSCGGTTRQIEDKVFEVLFEQNMRSYV